ncbi:MAG TPA: tetratricopeptide repeat protein [Thermoanaerobaculia bacterium]|nr:tetratricopeptide repeat protein [Thermoanaerobaculia bacterium]
MALIAILFLLASPGAAQKPADLTAVMTRIEGQVTLSPEGREQFRSVRRAALRQVIRRGENVHLPAGARVELICSTENLVSLNGPMDWVLDATACGRGLVLPESSYQNSVPHAGRLLPRNGALLLEFETRNGDGNLGPVLLSPRNTAVLDPRPVLVWTRVPDAIEYEIALRGPVAASIHVAAEDLHCGHGSGPWHDLDICSWAPSGKWPSLEPEKSVSLRIGYRQALAASLREAREVYEIHLFSVNDQSIVQERLRRIATLPMDKASRLLLAAGAYAQGGLYADAIAAYDEALKDQEVPEARVTLGDLYLTIGLTALADREYRQVLAGTPDLAAQAAAELGLGQVAYIRKLFSDARARFEHARDLYATLGLSAEAEEAREAAVLVQDQSGNDLP